MRNRLFTPENWFWIVAGDTSRAWSSAQQAYVLEYPDDAVTRIASEVELADVLRPYGLRGPLITADDVRAEAQRRIVLLVGATDITSCLIKQLNANMRANELNDIRHDRELTEQEQTEAIYLRDLAEKIKSIRASSNAFPNPIPADYRDNKFWPIGT